MDKSNKNNNYRYIIGIDEAGRGPLAGPLVVGGVLLVVNNLREEWKILEGIRDSKKLSEKKRNIWFEKIKKHPQLRTAHAIISSKVIDKINIARAANLGAARVYQKLLEKIPKGLKLKTKLDGSLYLPKGVPCQTIIKGDEKIPTIAAASVVAKVTRDRIMVRLHKKFPEYGFDRHKGYGTKLHRNILVNRGATKAHRQSFLTKII
ncbi:MAG: ribonuclease HII [bacterium]|nr:ribonuclease HII [bacterium]